MPYQDSAGKIWSRSSPQIRQRARELRQSLTPTERILWDELRDRRLAGSKFRRQCSLGPIIADFYGSELKLIVEVDGDIHRDPIQKENDEERDEQCRVHGYTVLRFTAQQVHQNTKRVLTEIKRTVWALRSERLSQDSIA